MGAEFGAAIGSAIAGGITGLAQLGANIWSAQKQLEYNQRDFDYQRAIQQETWNREDNAVQRRMADLKAAGLNPNLAAGSAASSGAIVGRSNTNAPSINVGNPVGMALDMAQHVAQLRGQREQNQILNNQKRESQANADMAENEALLNKIELNNLLGLRNFISTDGKKFQVHWDTPQHDWQFNSDDNRQERYLDEGNSRLINYLNWQYLNNKNSADLLQKDVDWYTADKIANYAGTIGNLWSSAGSGYKSFTFGRRR